MSYILDALKKADQEREQGQVPGLHAHQTLSADAPAAAVGLSPLAWAGIGVALTLAAVLTWRQWPAAATPPLAQAPQAMPSAAPSRPTNDATLTASPPVTAPALPPRDVALHVEAAPALTVPAPRASERGAEQYSTPADLPSQGDAPASRPPSASVPKLAELPEAVRKDLPALNVGGAMHSPTPAQRMLVLNGQVFHEGDSPLPGLKLEEIRLKSAVLNFQGQRFELPY